jgi:5-deoxy-glucuronate isomerase
MTYLRQYTEKEGCCSLTEEGDLSYIEFGIVSLKAGSSFRQEEQKDKETGLIFLKGEGEIKTGGKTWKLKRESVFSQKACGIYIPPGVGWTMKAEKPSELAVARAPSEKRGEPVLISPEMVKQETRGKNGFRREVYDIIDERVDAEKLIIGETINFPGEWSSFPPHKHDKDNLPEESKLEEFYLFKMEPEEGFGLTRLYTAEGDLDTAYVIRNNSFLLIPRGYHPIAAIPGYKLYYLWILAGEGRKLVPNDDPAFKWLK